MNLEGLPFELLCAILRRCPVHTLPKLAGVSRAFCAATRALWEPMARDVLNAEAACAGDWETMRYYKKAGWGVWDFEFRDDNGEMVSFGPITYANVYESALMSYNKVLLDWIYSKHKHVVTSRGWYASHCGTSVFDSIQWLMSKQIPVPQTIFLLHALKYKAIRQMHSLGRSDAEINEFLVYFSEYTRAHTIA